MPLHACPSSDKGRNLNLKGAYMLTPRSKCTLGDMLAAGLHGFSHDMYAAARSMCLLRSL
jgi:hypothetical protein